MSQKLGANLALQQSDGFVVNVVNLSVKRLDNFKDKVIWKKVILGVDF